MNRPPLRLQTTTLWYYPSQQIPGGRKGDPRFDGATPAYVIWNLLHDYQRQRVLSLVADLGLAADVTLQTAEDTALVGVQLPAAVDVRDVHGWAGHYEMTPDHNPVIGPCGLDGFFAIAGFSGHGFQQAPAAAAAACFRSWASMVKAGGPGSSKAAGDFKPRVLVPRAGMSDQSF